MWDTNKTSCPSPSQSQKIRTLIVDDSLVIRGILRKILATDLDIDVVGAVGNGQLALEALDQKEIDAIILDLEMPVMDGMTALPLLLQKKPDLIILIASTLTLKNADISMECLAFGAKDYISKPTTQELSRNKNAFQENLIQKLKTITLSLREQKKLEDSKPQPIVSAKEENLQSEVTQQKTIPPIPSGSPSYTLRPLPDTRPKALVIGCSTGGPQALGEVFQGAKGKFKVPIFIAQHMPPMFTKSLASYIERNSGIPTKEGEQGERVEPGVIYIAPGNFHMEIQEHQGNPIIHLNQAPPENFCRPSVNPLMRSCIKTYKGNALSLILTGLGQDGLQGAKEFVEQGGTIITQNQQTSVVWGMPGAVTKSGFSSAVLPLNKIQSVLDQILNTVNPKLGVKF